MRKNAFNRCICLVLAAVMLFALAACGEKKPEGPAAETPDYVWKAEYTELGKERSGVYNPLITENGYYATISEAAGEMEHDGPEEYEGQYTIYENRLYFFDFSGNRTDMGYRPYSTEFEDGHEGNCWISSMTADENGNIWMVENVSEYWSTSKAEKWSDEWYAGYNYKDSFFLRAFSPDGKELASAPLQQPEDIAEGNFYINGIAATSDYLLCACDSVIAVYNLDGSVAFTVSVDNWVDSLVVLADGRVCGVEWAGGGRQLDVIDLAAKKIGEKINLRGSVNRMYSGSGEYDFCYSNGSSLYGYKLADKQGTKLFSWINLDINGDEISEIKFLPDGNMITLENSWNKDYTEATVNLIRVNRVPYDPATQKQSVTLAVQYLSWNVTNQIIEFNRRHDDIRIDVVDYSEYNTDEDYSAGLTKLQTEIVAGNVPDLMYLEGLPVKQYAAKGIFEDLYPWLDQDPKLSRSDFFPNALAMSEENGKLVGTASGFYINTLAGASSVVGDEPGWNYKQFMDALATMPEGCTALDVYTSRYDMLQTGLFLDMDYYVDWNTGKCNFDSQRFVDLLKFSSNFPNTFDWDNYDSTDYKDTASRIQNGEQMLLNVFMSDFNSLQEYAAYFGGKATYIGFPNESGNGSMISGDAGYAMSSTCKNKEAAWEFLRTFFTEDYQKEYVYNFPSNIKAYELKEKDAMTPIYRKDENGNFLLDEDGNRIEESRGGMGFEDGTHVEFYAITQEQADQIRELIASTTHTVRYDDSINSIVNEVVEAYYSNQKSAEETAKLVQSRVSLYVNEQR